MGRYILAADGRTAVECPDLIEWASWFEKADRTVRKTKVGPVEVSTVFLALDHQYGGGAPLLFETMVFGGEHDQHQERCSTWDQAESQHKTVCDMVFGSGD